MTLMGLKDSDLCRRGQIQTVKLILNECAIAGPHVPSLVLTPHFTRVTIVSFNSYG